MLSQTHMLPAHLGPHCMRLCSYAAALIHGHNHMQWRSRRLLSYVDVLTRGCAHMLLWSNLASLICSRPHIQPCSYVAAFICSCSGLQGLKHQICPDAATNSVAEQMNPQCLQQKKQAIASENASATKNAAATAPTMNIRLKNLWNNKSSWRKRDRTKKKMQSFGPPLPRNCNYIKIEPNLKILNDVAHQGKLKAFILTINKISKPFAKLNHLTTDFKFNSLICCILLFVWNLWVKWEFVSHSYATYSRDAYTIDTGFCTNRNVDR